MATFSEFHLTGRSVSPTNNDFEGQSVRLTGARLTNGTERKLRLRRRKRKSSSCGLQLYKYFSASSKTCCGESSLIFRQPKLKKILKICLTAAFYKMTI
uniref:Uncharacterized protein n=1 Tax=Romanomermis culicivorax TaxID=13658 RepID=A0A915K3P7_ROMCU